MHMSDALITPIVGGAMLASSMGVMRTASKKIDMNTIEKRVPYMGVVGAFVFASQMINFAIPGTGSSGHIGGGMLLAILLGPHAGFMAMASILLIQALFFADGGLLAYGCNLFNLGVFTCYVAYPLIYKPIVHGKAITKRRIFMGAILATIVGLQLGSFSVVVQTLLSGRTDLPFMAFTGFMLPIHLAIGIVEGLITAAIVAYLYEQREDLVFDIFSTNSNESVKGEKSLSGVLRGIAIAAIIVGAIMSQFASSSPDGLEWSIENVSAAEEVSGPLDEIQGAIAILPDYDFSEDSPIALSSAVGTGVSGIAGSIATLMAVMGIGLAVRRFSGKKQTQ